MGPRGLVPRRNVLARRSPLASLPVSVRVRARGALPRPRRQGDLRGAEAGTRRGARGRLRRGGHHPNGVGADPRLPGRARGRGARHRPVGSPGECGRCKRGAGGRAAPAARRSEHADGCLGDRGGAHLGGRQAGGDRGGPRPTAAEGHPPGARRAAHRRAPDDRGDAPAGPSTRARSRACSRRARGGCCSECVPLRRLSAAALAYLGFGAAIFAFVFVRWRRNLAIASVPSAPLPPGVTPLDAKQLFAELDLKLGEHDELRRGGRGQGDPVILPALGLSLALLGATPPPHPRAPGARPSPPRRPAPTARARSRRPRVHPRRRQPRSPGRRLLRRGRAARSRCRSTSGWGRPRTTSSARSPPSAARSPTSGSS